MIRIAIIGTGWAATTLHLPGLLTHPEAEVVAVCDLLPGRAERVAAGHRIPYSYDDPADLFAAGIADAVVIATPHPSHYPLVKRALLHDHHVLVEKPMTTSAADAFALVELSEQRRRHLAVGYTYQYAETAERARRAVQTEIGDLIQVIAQFSSNAGVLYQAADATDDTRPDVPHPSTYAADQAGGQAHAQLSHLLGMVCWATGREIDVVQAFVDHRGLAVDVDDVATFRFVDGGTGVAASTGASGGPMIKHHVRYLGTAGAVDQDMLSAALTITSNDRIESFGHGCEPTYRVHEPARAFVDLLLGRRENQSPARPAAAAVAAVESILDAAHTGKPVTVPKLPAAPAPTDLVRPCRA